MVKSMTEGSPTKVIVGFTLPILIGNVFQQFYSMADTIIVGKTLGSQALAGVGSTGTISFLFFGLIAGMSVGFTVLTAQKFGAGDMDAMRKTVGCAVVLSAVITAVMTVVTILFMKPLLNIMNTPDSFYSEAYNYIIVISAGLFAQVMYNLLSSVLRALGDSRAPLYFLIISALLNIGLDFWFIAGIGMGTEGAAYATVISQLVSSVLCFVYIVKRVPVLRLKKSDFRPDKSIMLNQLRLGCPMALQYSVTAVGAMILQSALNPLGHIAVSGYTAANKIEQIGTQAYVACGTTMATYCAQNTGAGEHYRIRRGFRSIMLLSVIYTVVISPLFFFFGKNLTGLFVSEDVLLIMPYADMYIKYMTVFLIPLAVVNIFRNGLQGVGLALMPFLGGVAELLARWAVAALGAAHSSYRIICLASPLAWVAAAVLLLAVYYFAIVRRPQYKKPKTEG